MILRRAVPGDAEALVELRIQFMRIVKDSGIPEEDGLRKDLQRHFGQGIRSGRLRAFLAEEGGEVVASAAIRLDRRRERRDGRAGPGAKIRPVQDGYVMSVFTRPGWRRRGIARVLMASLLEEARSLGLGRLVLHATDDGKDLYESLGFRPFRTVMILDLAEAAADSPGAGTRGERK